MAYVFVRSYSQAMEAQMVAGALQAEGIETHLENEYLVQQDWLVSNAVGGVRLHVVEDRADDARRIIGDFDAAEAAPKPLTCPRCESTNTEFNPPKGLRKAALIAAIFLTGGLALFARRTYKLCLDCGAHWG